MVLAVGLGAQTKSAPKEKTAAEVYKNVQVLKNIPASELRPGMGYITTALGVECSFCHVKGNFASDDKRTKRTARQMMKMLFAINQTNFEGRPEVSCFTCHQGHHEPMSVPQLPPEIVPARFLRSSATAPAQPLPRYDALLKKFATALGGEGALGKITSRSLEVEETRDGKTFRAEFYQKAPDKFYSVTTLPRGSRTAGFDGSRAWVTTPRGTEKARDIEANVLRTEAQINPVAALRAYKGLRVFGQAQIGNSMAYVMRAIAPGKTFEFLLFDEKTGLLVRRSIRVQTIFGSLPLEAEYSEYRKVDGVAIPFKTTWSTAGQSWTYVVRKVKDNVPVEDSKFAPPARKE